VRGTTNPEQLLAAGYAACFHEAVNVAARKLQLPLVPEASVMCEL
jgi:organic hydroperoxide reductase OsmC/OhrA